jgi:MFS family permease
VGVVLLDLGVQANHISNQTRILGLSADARNRLNSVYVAIYFTGAAAGSALASLAYASWRWAGVSALGIGLAVLALAAFFTLDTKAAKAADEAAARRRDAEAFPRSRPAGGHGCRRSGHPNGCAPAMPFVASPTAQAGHSQVADSSEIAPATSAR